MVPVINSSKIESIKLSYNEYPIQKGSFKDFLKYRTNKMMATPEGSELNTSLQNVLSFTGISDCFGLTY